MRWRYAHTHGRRYKSRLIEELIAVCGYSRKHAIKLLNKRGVPRVLKRSGPKPIYQQEVRTVLKRIWFASDQLCGKRLKAALPEWLPHYEKESGALQQPLKEKLAVISAASIDRLLAPVRAKARPKGRGGTKPGRWLKNQIPLATEQWDEQRPGFMEATRWRTAVTVCRAISSGACALPIWPLAGPNCARFGTKDPTG